MIVELTLNFGTDNIYFVPEGKSLRIFDIYHMRCRELDLTHWNLHFNSSEFNQIENALHEAGTRWEKSIKHKNTRTRGKQILQSFLQNFPNDSDPAQPCSDIQRLFSHQQITFWVRCSDTAQESFYAEDYPESSPVRTNKVSVPVMGSIFLSGIGDFELCIHENVIRGGFFLGFPEHTGIVGYPLPPDEILPLDEEFFGAFGSSGLGRIINLTHDSRISAENLCCTPLFRTGPHFYVTLYFHLVTKVDFDVLLRIPERKIAYMRSVLAELGFKLFFQYKENRVYRRKESVVHLYSNAVGKESFNHPFLSPFLLITLNEGSTDPSTRSKLMAEFLPRISKW